MAALKYLWTQHPVAMVICGAAFALTAFFAFDFLAEVIYFNDPRHRDQALEGWMTVRYVSQSYEIPPEVLRDAWDLTREDKGPVRMLDVMGRTGLSLTELQESVEALQESARAREADRS